VTIKVTFTNGDQPPTIKINILKDQFEIVVDEANFKASDAKVYPLEVALEDGISAKVVVNLVLDVVYPV